MRSGATSPRSTRMSRAYSPSSRRAKRTTTSCSTGPSGTAGTTRRASAWTSACMIPCGSTASRSGSWRVRSTSQAMASTTCPTASSRNRSRCRATACAHSAAAIRHWSSLRPRTCRPRRSSACWRSHGKARPCSSSERCHPMCRAWHDCRSVALDWRRPHNRSRGALQTAVFARQRSVGDACCPATTWRRCLL